MPFWLLYYISHSEVIFTITISGDIIIQSGLFDITIIMSNTSV